MLHTRAVARSSFDGIAIRYVLVLPVLRMTSRFHIMQRTESKTTSMFRPVRQTAAPTGRQTICCLVEIVRLWHRGEVWRLPLHVVSGGSTGGGAVPPQM